MDLSDASTVSKDLGAQLEKVIQYNGARPVATLPNWCLVRVDTCSIVDLKTVKKKKRKENKRENTRYDICPIMWFIKVLYYIVKCFLRLDNSKFIIPSNGTKQHTTVL